MAASGITPAWAGKSFSPCPEGNIFEDHPRMGGEKLKATLNFTATAGSPPHGRGKAAQMHTNCGSVGITPAWAGKREKLQHRRRCAQDHPRMGGEKYKDMQVDHFKPGSPPHGRGKVEGLNFDELRTGITPAWAGKRLKRSHRSGIFISGPIPFHSALHRPAGSGGSRAGRDGSPAGQPQNAGPA